jgi:centrin-1
MSKTTLYKKVTPRNGLADDEIDELRQAFELFDTKNTGKINPKELKASMQSLGYDLNNPTIYQLVDELDNEEVVKLGGISFSTLVDAVNRRLGDKDNREGLRKLFELFSDDPNADVVSLQSLKTIAKEIGEQMSNDDLREMMERASSNGSELTFEDFYEIMSRKTL